MSEIFFLLFAFLTVFLSIKLSYYADGLSKSSKLNGLFIGGLILAGVTSLPEFVTCFSAFAVSNNELAVGDILGSNVFNVFMICFFDLVFLKHTIFFKTNKSHNLVFILLLFNYLVLYLFLKRILALSILYVSIPTLFIIITYWFYIYKISNNKKNNNVIINDNNSNDFVLKLFVTSLFMVFCSVILTVLVNNIAKSHPSFSSSFLGAIFLGVTTSLPEVVTCYTLLSMKNYDLALSDIIGSNFFNLLVLAIGDLFVRGKSIYSFSDSDEIMLVVLGFIFIFILFISNRIKTDLFKKCYGVLSFLIVISYLTYWVVSFL